jgi:predicted HTH transcriptional regulator
MELFQKRSKETLTSRRSPRQDLSFNYLRQHYVEKGYEVGDNFLIQLELYTEEDEFNYLAYLLSDQNCLKYQYARYDGDDVFNLVEHKEFGNQSILKTTSDILEFIQNRNSTFSQITATGRTDRNKFNAIAMRELIVNAIVHNNYLSNGLPAFEEFSNRFEISSFGGLPEGFSQEDFLNGYSLPVNPELIRVFRDLGLAERLGTGIRRVLKFYPKEIFRFSSNFLRVNLPFERPIPSYERMREEPKTSLMNLLKEEPGITRAYAAERLGISESSVYRELKRLEETGKIRREGSKKNVRWVVD